MVNQKRKIDDIWFDIEKDSGHLGDLTIDQYMELLEIESIIANDSRIYSVPIKEVIKDILRYGSQETNIIIIIKAFLDNTVENTRKGVRTGRDNKVVYLGYGDNVHDNRLELALLSAHIPGSSGSGGWGLNGDRRLLLAHKRDYEIVIDPEIWLKNADAFVYESQNGKLRYETLKDHAAKTILMMAINNSNLNDSVAKE